MSASATLAGSLVSLLGADAANSYFTVQLQNTGNVPPSTTGGLIAPLSTTITANSSGAYSQAIYATSQITPSGTFYLFTIFTSSNQFVMSFAAQVPAGTNALQELTQINQNQVPITTPLAVPQFQVAGTLLTSTSIINYEGDGTYISTSNPSGGQVEISLLKTGITFATPGVIYTAPGLVELGGTATFTLVTQSANTIFAGPSSGSAATPTFRNLVSLDIPNNAANTTGNAATVTGLSVTSGKTLAVSNSLTLAGTDSTTMTFPSSSDTVVTLAASQTLSNKTFTAPILGTPTSGTLTNCTFPVLNQNTTGTAGGLSGTPSITVNAISATTISSLGSQTLAGALGVAGVVYTNVSTGHSAVISNSTVYNTTAAGYYRVSAMVWPTTNSSSAWDVYVLATVTPNGGTAAMQFTVSPVVNIDGAAVAAWGQNSMVYLASSATIGISIASTSGSNTGGVYSYSVTIERLG